MPIFTRRRTQAMLNDLAAFVPPAKAKALWRSLEDANTTNAIASELELGVLWAMQRVTATTIEPEFPGITKRPDALSQNLFTSGPAVVEVAAVSDDGFSDKLAMNRAADKISHFVGQHRKGLSGRLRFRFGHEPRASFRPADC